MIRYGITCINRAGYRVLATAAQGRDLWNNKGDAVSWLVSLDNHSEDNLASVHGEQSIGTFRVDSFECYDNGDPIGIYVKE